MSAEHEAWDEPRAVFERYRHRNVGDRYSILRPEVWQTVQGLERAILAVLAQEYQYRDLSRLKLTDVGCGSGDHLLGFLRYGFAPKNLCGIELLPDRAERARLVLPKDVRLYEADANSVDIEPASQDLVFQSVVFSSILNDAFQEQLAKRMWSWLKPGGHVLWYDFIYDNPGNRDVRGVPLKRVRKLFPEGEMKTRRLTLAPPISRRICLIHPAAYTLFNAIPLLRTHVLCSILKPTC